MTNKCHRPPRRRAPASAPLTDRGVGRSLPLPQRRVAQHFMSAARRRHPRRPRKAEHAPLLTIPGAQHEQPLRPFEPEPTFSGRPLTSTYATWPMRLSRRSTCQNSAVVRNISRGGHARLRKPTELTHNLSAEVREQAVERHAQDGLESGGGHLPPLLWATLLALKLNP